MNNKTWFVAGQGSIGSFIAYNAMNKGISCKQIVRELTQTSQTCFHPIDKDSILLPESLPFSGLVPASIQFLIVPLKAYDIVPFLTQVKPFLAENAAIVLCHNGLGTIELATELITDNMDLFFCTTNNGLYKNEQGVFQAGLGESLWSHVAGLQPEKLTNNDFTSLLGSANMVNNLQQVLWQKLVINCAINPLTAINKIKNGALDQDVYRSSIANIVNETLAVGQAIGVELKHDQLINRVYQVIQATANNYSSMYQDVHAHKKTEIDFITGHVVKLGKELGIPTPTSNLIYEQLKTLYNNQ
ncbi:2-dehydropantoate 2-reductase [Psychrosphaera aquimarina]|uniref:2-dehydropantoate 2-reductase n=1 Tax=Psychrosphaera aquimarina TaxID=2044854 RepID=A0ABU3R495_9GAMM|nr:2-dehydropantoate 2-reductase [Psychrosphaera aquimarina]MDU0114508.1 2-dehydropantoate 2-reductase [Psychrosphaera aquimarina]